LPDAKSGEGFVYGPLQGQATGARSFQSMSRLEMVGFAEARDARKIVVTLHPSEVYSSGERARLRMETLRPSAHQQSTERETSLLPRCDYVATQKLRRRDQWVLV